MRFQREGDAVLVIGRLVAPGAAATTLGRVVFVRRGHQHDRLLLEHELVHVRQYRDRGLLGFLVRYLWSYGRLRLQGWPHWAAYRRLPLEAAADWEARRLLGIGVPGASAPGDVPGFRVPPVAGPVAASSDQVAALQEAAGQD